MAKKSISDIVLRAVVDTSGVAAGLNNIGSQVAGRQFGQSGGGPTGASGAAGGFVNPHGGSAPGSVAATAAAAAFGAGLGRGGGPGATGPATGAGAGFRSVNEPLRNLYARAGQGSAILGNPLTTMLYNRFQQPLLQRANALFDAANMAREAGSRTASDLYSRQGNRIRANFDRRNAALARLAQSRTGRAAGGAYGALRGIGQGIGTDFKSIGTMLGFGRFAGAGLAGMGALGVGLAGMRALSAINQIPGQFEDLSRFNFGEDRAAAAGISRYLRPPGQKAPLGWFDRYMVEARKMAGGGPSWQEKAIKGASEGYQYTAERAAYGTSSVSGALAVYFQDFFPLTAIYYQLKRVLS